MPTSRRFMGTLTPAAESNSTWPCTATRPSSGVSSPARQRNVVVLPHPEGPNSVKNVPSSSVKEALRMPPAMVSVVLAKILVRRSISSMGWLSV